MSAKFLSLIAGVSALALAGTVQAAEPVHAAAPLQLTVAQMDSVTAAGDKKNYKHKNHKHWVKPVVCKTKPSCGKPTPPPAAPKGSAVADATASATASAPATYNVVTDAFAFTDTTVTATTVSAVSVATASSSAKPAPAPKK